VRGVNEEKNSLADSGSESDDDDSTRRLLRFFGLVVWSSRLPLLRGSRCLCRFLSLELRLWRLWAFFLRGFRSDVESPPPRSWVARASGALPLPLMLVRVPT